MTDRPAPDQLVAVLTADGPRVLTADEPIVHADDLGLTRGDGCFDATLVRPRGAATPTERGWVEVGDHGVLHLDAHLARLARSARGLDVAGIPDAGAWTALLEEALAGWTGSGETMLKLVLTRGREERPAGPFAYLTLTALGAAMLDRRAGVDVVTLSKGITADAVADLPWLLPGNKTIAYAQNMAAQREARARGAHDALWVSTDDYVLEGPTSSLVVLRDGTLVSVPAEPTGILASITVETLFAAAETDGLRTERRLIRPDEIGRAQASWLVSSVRGVAPIRSLDGTSVPTDADADARLTRLAGF